MRRLGLGQQRKLGSGMTFRVQWHHLVFSAFCLSLILLVCFRWQSQTFTFTNHTISLVLFSVPSTFLAVYGMVVYLQLIGPSGLCRGGLLCILLLYPNLSRHTCIKAMPSDEGQAGIGHKF